MPLDVHSHRARLVLGLLLAVLLVGNGAQALAQITLRASSSASVPTLPQLRAGGALAFANNGDVTPALPAGTAAGDFLLCLVESRDDVAHAMPAGWTQIAQQNSGASHRASLWW
jgi:MSHA biogenesis protein MshQ